MKKTQMQKLYEQVREYDDLLKIPNEVRYSELHSIRSSIDNLVKEINQFNIEDNGKDSHLKLKRLFNSKRKPSNISISI